MFSITVLMGLPIITGPFQSQAFPSAERHPEIKLKRVRQEYRIKLDFG